MFHFDEHIFLYRLSICDQKALMMEEYKSGWAARAANEPEDEIIRSGWLKHGILTEGEGLVPLVSLC
jgi:hypothetical protein